MIVSTINAREVESNRVSRLLHDEVGQVLSCGRPACCDVLKLDFGAQVPELTDRVNEIQKMLDQSVEQVRSLSYDLNPSVVERAGLQMAFDRLVGRFREKFSGSIRYLYDSSVRVPLNVGNTWYKIAELALENAIRHASATRIEVHVRRTQKNLSLEIRDNGGGFSLEAAKMHPKGLGLIADGALCVSSADRSGCEECAGQGNAGEKQCVPEPAGT